MPGEPALLLLADIGGYTAFMRLHRLSLAHSQEITRRLLEAMLDAVPSLTLVEVEGDALFLYAQRWEPGRWLDHVLDMHRAFHARQQWMLAHNLCSCDACRQIGVLRVKFAAHAGEVTTQTIRGREKLVGVDVIAVHRMLKNTVPAAEYVLMSEALYTRSTADHGRSAIRLDQELEGLGVMPTYFLDLDDLTVTLAPPPDPAFHARVRETLGVGLRALPSLVGLRRRS